MPKKVRKNKTTQKISSFRWMESYTSLLMGIVVVIIAVLFVVSFAKQNRHIQQTSSTNTFTTPIPTGVTQTLPGVQKGEKEYTVQAGDDLWHIAEKYYNSGYNWVDIANANHLENPSILYAGIKLIIPSVQPKIATVITQPSQSENAITGNSYTVVHGDDLWHIAVRAYGDGYKWVNIAKVNNLINPSLIHSGNVLIIPR